MNIHVENLKLEGITKIQKCFSVSECEKFIQSLEEIVIANKKQINYTSGENSTFTPNFFRHNLELLELIDIPIVNDISIFEFIPNYPRINHCSKFMINICP